MSRDLTVAVGRRRILADINASSKTGAPLDLFNLSPFDTGIHADMLYNFSARADERTLRLYLDLRGWVGQARQPLASVDFWRGLKVLHRRAGESRRHRRRTERALAGRGVQPKAAVARSQPSAIGGGEAGGALSPMQLSQIIAFIRTDGSLGLARVLWSF